MITLSVAFLAAGYVYQEESFYENVGFIESLKKQATEEERLKAEKNNKQDPFASWTIGNSGRGSWVERNDNSNNSSSDRDNGTDTGSSKD